MINASRLLQKMQDAKRAHLRWVKNAENLVEKFHGEEDVAALRTTTCGFGYWFYSSGQKLREIKTIGNIMNRIEVHHDNLHDSYADIYNIYFTVPLERPFFKKVITFNSKKITKTEQEMARVHFKYLNRSSKEILELLNILEQKIKGLEYTEIQKLKDDED